MSRKDPSVPTSITIQLCEDSLLIKDAAGKTRIASSDDDTRISKIIREIASDTNQPELDIHNLKVTNDGVTGGSGSVFDNIDITDMDSLKKVGTEAAIKAAMKYARDKKFI